MKIYKVINFEQFIQEYNTYNIFDERDARPSPAYSYGGGLMKLLNQTKAAYQIILFQQLHHLKKYHSSILFLTVRTAQHPSHPACLTIFSFYFFHLLFSGPHVDDSPAYTGFLQCFYQLFVSSSFFHRLLTP